MIRLSHAEVQELLGAYALDAVDAEEAQAVAGHLETCPRCRDELTNHLEVVGLLAYAGQEAPAGLWDRVVARINDPAETDVDAARVAPPALRLVRVDPDADGDMRAVGPTGRRRWTRITTLVAAAAVVVVGLLGVQVVHLEQRTNHLSGQVSAMADQPSMTQVRAALADPGARRVQLRSLSGHGVALDAVITPSGEGFLYDSSLSPLSSDQTYQLWGVVGDERISYGVMGASPAKVMAFQASAGVDALAVTAEVAGGVVSSSHSPVVVGALQ